MCYAVSYVTFRSARRVPLRSVTRKVIPVLNWARRLMTLWECGGKLDSVWKRLTCFHSERERERERETIASTGHEVSVPNINIDSVL
jgi:hypothetical protein